MRLQIIPSGINKRADAVSETDIKDIDDYLFVIIDWINTHGANWWRRLGKGISIIYQIIP